MKIYLILILALTCQLSFAQCDTSFLLSFNQITEIRGAVSSPINAEGTITFNKDNILIKALVNGYEKVIVSNIRSIISNWIVCFKDGDANYSLYSGKDS